MEKREIEFTTRLTREDVAGLIEALIEGLKDGKLKIKKSNDVLELDVPRVVDLEVEACIDDERAEFEIEVSWRTNRAENPDLPVSDHEDRPAADSAGGKSGHGKSAAAKEKSAPAKNTASKAAPKSKSATGAKKTAAPKAKKSAAATAPKGASRSTAKTKGSTD